MDTGLSFKRVARTTALIEAALRTVDSILIKNFDWKKVEWSWREVFETKTIDSDRSVSEECVYECHDKQVKVTGKTSDGHMVTAVLKFAGNTHIVSSRVDGDDNDHSEPLSVKEVSFLILTDSGKRIDASGYMHNLDTTFFFEKGSVCGDAGVTFRFDGRRYFFR